MTMDYIRDTSGQKAAKLVWTELADFANIVQNTSDHGLY